MKTKFGYFEEVQRDAITNVHQKWHKIGIFDFFKDTFGEHSSSKRETTYVKRKYTHSICKETYGDMETEEGGLMQRK